MIGKQIVLNKFTFCNTPAIISTVKIFGEYETMVMYNDGEEIESFISSTQEEARQTHKETVKRWNDRMQYGTFNKCLGIHYSITSIIKA